MNRGCRYKRAMLQSLPRGSNWDWVMLRAWTFVIVGLNSGLLLLALLLAGAANSLGVPWSVGFAVVGTVYLLLGISVITVVWRAGRSAFLEEVGGSLIFAGSVCLVLAPVLQWLEQRQALFFHRQFG
jgi:hypothetical protein